MTRVLQVMAGAVVGGAEEFFMRLVPALARAGVRQEVVLRRHDARETILRTAGVKTIAARFGGPFDLATGRVIRRAVDSFKPDVVLAWMSRATRFAPSGQHILAARLGGYYDLKYYCRCDHLICNTEAIRNYVVTEGWPTERAWYIPNFVDSARAGPAERVAMDTPPDAPLLLALGRLHENKAYDVMIEAMSDIPDAFFWIAGDGPREGELRKAAETAGVDGRVRFLGWRTDTAALLAAADLLVCPSRHEPLGNVVIEAWAHDTPVVAANSDGPRNLIRHGETGLLVPVNDADALARAINDLLKAPERAADLASAGLRAYEASFTEDIVVRQYQAFFEEVAH